MHRDSSHVPSALDARRPPSPGPSRAQAFAILGALIALALLVRLPLLLDATHRFNSDEAVDALVMRHLLDGRELTLFNWDSTYYGIVEGLLALPFVPILGQAAVTWKLGAVVAHGLLLVAAYLLGGRLYGRRAGLLAAATLVVFSPMFLYWSQLASGGYGLVVAVGTFTLWQLDRVVERPSSGRVLALGALAGFGFYVYQLFLVYLAAMALWLVPRTLPWRAVFAGSRAEARRTLAGWRAELRFFGALGAGFLAGAAPVLFRIVAGTAHGGKEPSYLFADWPRVKTNAVLLVRDAAPVLLGLRPTAGAPLPLSRVLAIIFVLVLLVAWLGALRRTLPAFAATVRPQARPLATEELLVLLGPVAALLFVLSPNVQDYLSNRYLLPCLSALAVLTGAWLERWWRSGRMGAAAASVCAAAPLVATVLMFPFVGLVASADRAIVHDEPLATLVADLERRGIHEAYGPYWTAYKATFLAEERVVVAPLAGWDRYPAYTARVDRAPREAYIFNTGDPELGRDQQEEARNAYQRFEARLAAGEIAYERRDYGFFRLYAAAEPRRLLPPPDRRPIVALARPAATLRLLDPPSRLEPGQTTRVRVQVTNASDGFWSADGFPRLAGSHRVSASFRWLAPDGTAAVVEGVRTPLPHDVQVGETARLAVLVEAPAAAGSYNLRVTLVQENVAWFDQATGSQATCRIDVR